jgi:hypothetical protein
MTLLSTPWALHVPTSSAARSSLSLYLRAVAAYARDKV